MPFTFSHPAIILPLKYLPNNWISMTGLIIGSLSPDFEYFIRMRIQSNYSHEIIGIFLFDIPISILFAFVFHNIIRNTLFDNLPIFLKSRLATYKQFNWNKYFLKNWYIVIISIFIGAFSHIFWDSFTHSEGFFVKIISILTNEIEILHKQIPIYKLFQHLSALIGGLIIAIAFWKLPKDKNISKKINFKYWIFIVLITAIIVIFSLFNGLDYRLYGNLIVTCISATIISSILAPLISKKNRPI